MFTLHADKNRLTVRQREALTSGSVNVNTVQFVFSEDWEGLTRTAVFRYGDKLVSIFLDEGGQCRIPGEVLEHPGRHLMAGVYGIQGETVVLPTVWADLGVVLEGAKPGEASEPPAAGLWEQALAGKGDALRYTESGELGLYAGDRLLGSVPVMGEDSPLKVGHGLKLEAGTLAVQTVDRFEGDMTLPVTAAAVNTVVGNVEVLLGTI